MDILKLTAVELGQKIKSRKISCMEATAAVIKAIEKQRQYNCFITIAADHALKKAAEIEKKIAAGQLTGPLAGVPIAIKDNICTKGILTTCASKILSNFVPTYTATAVENLEAAGVIVIGKTNMDEFAMGSTTETSYFGITRNPHNREHVPGGSSGGSAAAVALHQSYFALGSDTGGSIRQPAGYCGIVGMKPTYGRVSRYGLIAYASSLDQIGPLCKDVTDCATVLETISSYDPRDSTSVKQKDTNFTSALVDDVAGLRIGIPKGYYKSGLDENIKKNIFDAIEIYKAKGAIVEEFELNLIDYAIPTYYTLAAAEASSNLERFDGMKYGYRCDNAEKLGLYETYSKTRSQGFGPEVKRRIMLGSFVLSSGYYDAYYLKALKVKALIKKSFNEAFKKYDILIAPTAPTTAPKIGSSLDDPIKMYLSDIYTISVNLAGLPGITIPCGTDRNGMPVGMQLIADCFKEEVLIQAAYTYECTGHGAIPTVNTEEV